MCYIFPLLVAGSYCGGKVVHQEGFGTSGMGFGPRYDWRGNRGYYGRAYDVELSGSGRDSGEISGISGGGISGLIGEHYGGYRYRVGFIVEKNGVYTGRRRGSGSRGGRAGGYIGGDGGYRGELGGDYRGGHVGEMSDGISVRQRGGIRGGRSGRYISEYDGGYRGGYGLGYRGGHMGGLTNKNSGIQSDCEYIRGLCSGFTGKIDGGYRGGHGGGGFNGQHDVGLSDGIIDGQSDEHGLTVGPGGGLTVGIDGVYRERHGGAGFSGGLGVGSRNGIIGRQIGVNPSFSFISGPRRILFPQ